MSPPPSGSVAVPSACASSRSLTRSASTLTCTFSSETDTSRPSPLAWRKKVRPPGGPTVPATNRSGGSKTVAGMGTTLDREPDGQLQAVARHETRVAEHLAGRAVGDDRALRRAPPPARTARRAYGRSWVTISTVTSSERRMSASSRREAGSRFDDGSSSTRISGRIASTVAMATRRRCPKDRWCGARSARSATPTALSASTTRRLELGAAQPEVGRAERDVVAHGRHEQLVVGVLEDDADPAPHLQQVRVGDRQAPTTVTDAGARRSGCR